MSSSLPSMPPEVLRRIVLHAIGNDEPGPPKEFLSILLTCKSMLELNTGDLHCCIFASKFEIWSPLRRLGASVLKRETIAELRRRFSMLKRVRNGTVDDNSIVEVLWIAYTMLEDIGLGSRSLRQLEWAKFPDFLGDYIQNKLYEESGNNDGWPKINERNSLAIALSWYCLNEGQSLIDKLMPTYMEAAIVNNEKKSFRAQIMHLLEPFVFAAFRYPIFGANEYFSSAKPDCHSKVVFQTTHGQYPPDPLPKTQITYFGTVTSRAHIPLAPLFASMLYFTRLETVAPVIPPHLRNASCQTRAEAKNLGHKGPTLEDVIEFVNLRHTRFIHIEYCGIGHHQRTLRIDLDEYGPHALGGITGRWQGSYILPFIDNYQSWLKTSTVPSDFKTTGRMPFFLTLEEHYTCEHENIIPHDGEENGTLHAWLPPGCRWEKKNDGIEIFDDRLSFRKFYKTYRQGDPDDITIADIIVTGETDDEHAAAWGAYSIFGRVRLDDGLVMLQRQSLNGLGTTLMRGYVAPCGNFVGRLKGASNGIAPSGWEGNVPPEILEHIAFHVATDVFLGPPSAIVSLISLNRHIYTHLSHTSNDHLYARIFAAKFDTSAAERRLGPQRMTPKVLALELQQRCSYLKRLRAQAGARLSETSNNTTLQDLLFHVYLMALENDGKNERQLREYGRIESWLKIYWFDVKGSSLAFSNLLTNNWPEDDPKLSTAMWLLWFFLRIDNVDDKNPMIQLLRTFALSAHQYRLSLYHWTDFSPTRLKPTSLKVVYYSEELLIEPTPLATPAILSFLTLVKGMVEDRAYPTPLAPSTHPLTFNSSLEWECEWGRCINTGTRENNKPLSGSFKPGSIDGVWEGFFTYTEFTIYAALLAGAPPSILDRNPSVARHRQTWKLREHHLIDNGASSDSEMDREAEILCSLSLGDPLQSYLPAGFLIKEDRDGVLVQEPGKRHGLHYLRAPLVRSNVTSTVKDIIITGEGHSAWGQFNLIGRVRPFDGFISISKEYANGDRGKWLYRGYLVGNVNGNLAGRWRDTLSPVDVPGYEGCFVMSRRR
ncbi:hypothetical protein APHAL10511_007554 [Amanita phalloides]|nr:hypothetical protein APHAL10511_007554 [Amanita phalloides]